MRAAKENLGQGDVPGFHPASEELRKTKNRVQEQFQAAERVYAEVARDIAAALAKEVFVPRPRTTYEALILPVLHRHRSLFYELCVCTIDEVEEAAWP